MKRVMVSGIAVAILGLGTGLWWYQGMSDDPNEGWKNAESSKKVTKQLPDDAIVLDVRTQDEFNVSHAKRAQNLPLDYIRSGILPTPDKSKPIYVYCRSGNRSAEAVTLLKKQGYSNITDIGAYENTKQYGL